METNEESYKEHLEGKYLPGRDQYLHWIYFPKILRQLNQGEILDLGFGTGSFLRFLKSKNKVFSGIDSNPYLVKTLGKKGFSVALDDITELRSISKPIKNAVIDNVLEHLNMEQIDSVFKILKQKMERNGILVVIVPLEKGYQRDPTHKTFVDEQLIQLICNNHEITLQKKFFHPINIDCVGKYFYLNMQVYTIKF